MNPGSESQWIQSVSWGNWVQGRNTTWMGQIITGHYTYSFPPRGNLGDMWLWSTNSTCCCAIRNANCDAEQMLTLISDCFPVFWAQKLYENLSQPNNLYINRAGCKACSFRLAIPNTWRQHCPSPHSISSRPSYMWFEKDFLWEKVWTIVCVFCLLNNIVPLTIRDATLTALIKDNNYLSKAIDLFNI